MPYQTAAAKKQFDSWSWHYDWNLLQLFFFRPAHKMILQTLLPADRLILDVGCGTGIFASRVLECRPETSVWAMDLSGGMLGRCRKRCQQAGGRLHLVQGDSERLPFADNTFDVVTCTHSFHHYPRQEKVADEMFRVLRPNGRLLIIDGDPGGWWGGLIYDGLVVLMEGPVRHLTGASFRELYRRAGFEHIKQVRRGGPLPFLLTVGSAAKSGAASRKRTAA
jgi:ubiquinone/menaquinone biosynthesis C-methylase UbiE